MTFSNNALAVVAVASFLVAPPSLAEEEEIQTAAAFPDGHPTQRVAPGFRWQHCQTVWHLFGDSWTWCFLDFDQFWIGTNDQDSEDIMRSCVASGNLCGVNFINAGGNWDSIQIWEP
jgi:hypothetical protein